MHIAAAVYKCRDRLFLAFGQMPYPHELGYEVVDSVMEVEGVTTGTR
ncbi:MAG: hypothetical protein NVS3B5_00720 [Sphingomicrobium sp.]